MEPFQGPWKPWLCQHLRNQHHDHDAVLRNHLQRVFVAESAAMQLDLQGWASWWPLKGYTFPKPALDMTLRDSVRVSWAVVSTEGRELHY